MEKRVQMPLALPACERGFAHISLKVFRDVSLPRCVRSELFLP